MAEKYTLGGSEVKTLKWLVVLFLLGSALAFGGWKLYLTFLPAAESLPKEIALHWSREFTDLIAHAARGRLNMDYKVGNPWFVFDYENTTDKTLTLLVMKCELPSALDYYLPLECFNAKSLPPGNFRFEFGPSEERSQKERRFLAEVVVVDEHGDIVGDWEAGVPIS